jgi:hypothetical protein
MLACLVGLHWVLLQAFAWTGMIVRYSRDFGVRRAIVMTFDGEHPCPLCLAIKAGRATAKERSEQQFLSGVRLEAVAGPAALAVGHFAPGRSHPTVALRAAARSLSPPKPRPRAAS